MHGLNESAVQELEELRAANNGFLQPEAIIERARSPNSSLHRYFTWDDSEAAAAFRLSEARRVIKAVVRYISAPNGQTLQVRAYMSLPSDRASGRGYTATAEILTDEARTAEALRQLERDVLALERRYGAFAQLRPALASMVALLPRAFIEQAERVEE